MEPLSPAQRPPSKHLMAGLKASGTSLKFKFDTTLISGASQCLTGREKGKSSSVLHFDINNPNSPIIFHDLAFNKYSDLFSGTSM